MCCPVTTTSSHILMLHAHTSANQLAVLDDITLLYIHHSYCGIQFISGICLYIINAGFSVTTNQCTLPTAAWRTQLELDYHGMLCVMYALNSLPNIKTSSSYIYIYTWSPTILLFSDTVFAFVSKIQQTNVSAVAMALIFILYKTFFEKTKNRGR